MVVIRENFYKKMMDACGLKEPYTFENRIFNAVMLLIATTGISTVILNLFIDNHISQTIVSAFCTLFPIACFLYSKRTKKYKHLIIPTIIYFQIILSVGWFVTGGVNGSIPFFFFILIIYCIVFVKKPFYFFVPFVTFSLIIMTFIDFYYPEYIINYDNKKQKYIDICFSVVLCLGIVGSIIHVIFQEYITERKNKDLMLAQAIKDRELIDKAMREIKVLKGMLPICCNCKKIRDDRGSWRQLEEYIHNHSEATFSHGLCSECAIQLYPDFFNADKSTTGHNRYQGAIERS